MKSIADGLRRHLQTIIRALRQNLIAKNFSYLLLSHVFSQLLMFASYSILTRRVSVEAFGKFSFAQAYYSYFLLILNLGLPIYGIKEFARLGTEALKLQLVNRILSLRLYILFLLILPYVLLAQYMSADDVTFSIMLCFSIGLASIVFELEWYYRAIQKMGYIVIGFGVKSLVFFLGVLIWVRNDGQILFAGLMFGLGFVASSLVFYAMSDIRRSIRIIKPGKWIFPLLKESILLGISLILIQVYYNFSILVLGSFRSETEVGYYSAIFKLVMFFLAIVGIYLKAVFPHLAELVNDTDRFKRFIVRLTRLSFFASLSVVVVCVLFADILLTLAFGDQYAGAAWAFQILIFLFWIIASRTLIENSLIIQNKTRQYLWAVVSGVCVNIVLNLVFVPEYGIAAAAWSALIAETTFAVVAFYLSEFKFHELFSI